MTGKPAVDGAIERIILVVESPLSIRDADRFGISLLEDAGFVVEVWEVAPLTLPTAEHSDVVRPAGVTLVRLATMGELREACASLSRHDAVVSLIGRQGPSTVRCAHVLAVLAASRALWCAASFRASWERTMPDVQTAAFAPDLTLPQHLILRCWVAGKSFARRVLSWSGRGRPAMEIRPLDIAWVATSPHEFSAGLVGPDTRIIPVHALDLDMLGRSCSPDPTAGGFIAYLDGLGPLHPDNIALGVASAGPSARDYFGFLNRGLTWLAAQTGLPVIVAAHPRAPRDGSLEAWYDGLEVRFGRTAETIAAADLVVMSYPSDALAMVVALGKPLIVITSQRTSRDERVMARAVARLLRARLYTVERLPGRLRPPIPDARRYARIRERFVKRAGSAAGSYWACVAASLGHAGRAGGHPEC